MSRRRGSLDWGELVEKARCLLSLSAADSVALVYSADENRPATGELAGKGFLRTGEGAGDCWVCERKAAKLEMAMLASVEAFWRGGED